MHHSDSHHTTACFSVNARVTPGMMPRVLELFAKRNLVPSAFVARVLGPDGEEMTMDIQMEGMERDLADYVAACMRQIVGVDVVLVAEKRLARSA
ncbi:MAG: hypothetical protein IT561_15370 [Alphaproteobacteria bacterium]|nr:hypothetical protein [Alphaproteobacteria bacterium]